MVVHIADSDLPILKAFADVQGLSIEDAAPQFADQYLGEWRDVTTFVHDYLQWEHDVPTWVLPYVNVPQFTDQSFDPDQGFLMLIGHEHGVWVFKTDEEPGRSQ